MQNYSIDQIREVLKNKGYKFFDGDELPYNVNIIGIRNTINPVIDSFDDTMNLIFRDGKQGSQLIHKEYACTTDAGLYYMQNPLSKEGVFRLIPNQYERSHEIGLHRGEYSALVQKGVLTGWRDHNKNDIWDYDASMIDRGMFGINIHRASQWKKSLKVDMWSAGCQVIQDPKDFDEFMSICRISMRRFTNSFTYTLLTDADFK